jgi:DNA polymerase III subunit gamma/tau
MSLYNKYRPQTFEEVKGNEDAVESLRNTIAKSTISHAYLFQGPTGCGKTTLAYIFARALGCVGNDLKEIDSGQFRGIDTVRDIRSNSSYKPIEGKRRGWVLDESQKMTIDAQNAMLKILENPPEHTFFFLCTTEPQKLIEPIRGRCIIINVHTLNNSQMIGLLKGIVRKEGETLAREVYEQIAQDSLGHPRNAINILEQVLSVPVERRLSIAQKSAFEQSAAIELCRSLIRGARWKEVSTILLGLKDQEPETIRRIILGYCQAVLLKNDDMRAGLIMENMLEPFYNTGFPGLVFACYSIMKG